MPKKITDFTPLENNPNAHTERGYEALEKSIGDLGYTEPMVASSDGVILSGNARYEKAGAMLTGEPIIVESDGTRPVIHVRTDVKGDSPQARRIVYASNRVAELDFALDLDVLLRDVQAGVDLSGLYTEGELEALLADLMPDEAPDDPGAQVDRAEELREKWQTERGQVWQVGRHRVMCGDSTSAEDVARLGSFETVITDVPYGISQEHNGLREIDYGEWDKGNVLATAEQALSLCLKAHTITAFCGDDQLSYLWTLLRTDKRTCRTVAWVKPNPTVLNGEHVFLPGLEVAAHGRKPGAWFGGKCVSSVWNGATVSNRVHPTQKPLELFIWLAEMTCPVDGVIYDPFLGSGTTLAACEQTGRTGYGMEIDPGYVAVILERLAGMGLEPKLTSDPMDQ